MHEPKKSKVKGVSFVRPTGKWKAGMIVNGKYKSFGFFEAEQDAIKARREGGIKYKKTPTRAHLSFIEDGRAWIALTQERWVRVDIEDFEELNTHNWHARQENVNKDFTAWSSRGSRANNASMAEHLVGYRNALCDTFINGNSLDCRKENLRIKM